MGDFQQNSLVKLDSDIDAIELEIDALQLTGTGTDDQTASEVPVTPNAAIDLLATNTQDALTDLADELSELDDMPSLVTMFENELL